MPQKHTRFDDYVSWLCNQRGKTKTQLADEVGHHRQYVWQMQHKHSSLMEGRWAFCRKVGEALADAAGKLFFLSGMNPWANRLSAEDQVALWEFVERVVMLKEGGGQKPSVAMFHTLTRQMFGGLSVLDNDAVMEALHGYGERDEETVGNPA